MNERYKERPQGASRRKLCGFTTPSQGRQSGEISPDQCLFLVAAPALDLALGCGGIIQPFKVLIKYQRHRSTESGIAAVCAGLMLRYPSFQAAYRRPDVVRTVGTTENVEVGAHC